jgi:acetyl-CoA synthetase
MDDYKAAYQKSIEQPEEFWGEVAESFLWRKKWDKVLEGTSKTRRLNGSSTAN